MKNGLFKLLPVVTLMVVNSSYAEYIIKIPLEQQSVSFTDAEVTGDISLTPSTINRGESANIEWNYTYADTINIEDVGQFQTKNGSVSVNPLVSRSYNIEVTNGTKKSNELLNLTVIQPNQNISFNANPTRIGIGQTALLDWNVSNSYGVRISNINDNNLPLAGSHSVSPTTSTSYTLTATGYEGVADSTETLNIEVVPNAIINNFSVDTDKITKGKSVVFSWNVSNAESLALNPFGPLVQKVSGTQSIPFNTSGNFAYTLEATSLSGVKDSESVNISVFEPAVITSFKVNGQNTVDVSPNADLNFLWNATSAPKLTLNGTSVSGTTQTLKANGTIGTTLYTLEATNGANDSVTDTVSVNVIGPAIINTFTAPTTVFTNSPFNLNWTATGANRYTLKSNNANSGITVAEENLETSLTKTATPTVAGSYSYTLSAYNTANAKTEHSRTVAVEDNPTFTGFNVNGQTSINVSPNASLSFVGTGFSTGAVLQGRNSGNTSNENLPSIANATAGTTTYYASATKTLNTITRNSPVRSVNVTVVNAPTIGTITAPTTIFANSTFTASWSGTNVTNYSISSNSAASGISTTGESLGTTASKTIIPTTAGTYTYTITATNAANVKTTKTFNVVVESDPSFTSFTVNNGTNISVSPATALNFAGSGFNSGSTLQGRNSANTVDSVLPPTAPTTFGTYTYYAAAEKTVNSTTRYSGLRSVVVTVSENWVSIAPTYTTWTNSGGVYSCTAWSPAASTVTINQSFTQTRSCSQNQTRTRQEREQEQYTKTIRNVGSPVTETNTITVTPSQTASGTKETWVAATPTYTSWVNSGGIYGCANWSPATSTVNSGQTFTQTANDCEQNQTRTRQNREQETTTLAYRNIGAPVNETNILYNRTSTRTATGTKSTYEINAGTGATCRSTIYNNMEFKFTIISYNYVEVYRQRAMGCLIPYQTSFVGNDGKTYLIGTFYSGVGWSVMRK